MNLALPRTSCNVPTCLGIHMPERWNLFVGSRAARGRHAILWPWFCWRPLLRAFQPLFVRVRACAAFCFIRLLNVLFRLSDALSFHAVVPLNPVSPNFADVGTGLNDCQSRPSMSVIRTLFSSLILPNRTYLIYNHLYCRGDIGSLLMPIAGKALGVRLRLS